MSATSPTDVTVAQPKKTAPTCRKKYVCCDTKCGCCVCCFVFTVLIIFVTILVSILVAYAQTFPATTFTNIEYDSLEEEGVKLYAYLATPSSPSNSTPAALVFHAWNGMSEEVTYFADRLAEQGYYALAPDLFRNVASESMNIIWNVINVINTPQDRMNADADAALAHLTSMKNVDNNRISSGPGFCFGGTAALIFSSRHPVAATVTCYGSYVKELKDPKSEAWGLLKEPGAGPVLGIFGETDTSPSPDDAKKFGAALEQMSLSHNISIYPNVGHAFITPESHKDPSDEHHQTTVDAWNEIESFLARVFNTTNTENRRLSVTAEGQYEVPLLTSLRHRLECAYKCASDHFTHTGHWRHGHVSHPLVQD